MFNNKNYTVINFEDWQLQHSVVEIKPIQCISIFNGSDFSIIHDT